MAEDSTWNDRTRGELRETLRNRVLGEVRLAYEKSRGGRTINTHWLTIASLTACAVVLTTICHEAVHAIGCVLLGGEIGRFSAVHVHPVIDAQWKLKLVAASGSLANLVIAASVFPILRRITQRNHNLVFFVWLFFSMNLMLGTGYWFASGITNVGDWAIVIRDWEPRWLYQIGLVVLGAVSLMVSVAWALVEFGRIVSEEGGKPIARAQLTALNCYATAFVVMLLIGTAQPGGPFAFPGVAGLAAVLGGLSPLLWMMQWFRADMFRVRGSKPLQIKRSVLSVVLAVSAVAFAMVLTAFGQR